MSERSVRTWGDVLAALQRLTPEQLKQPAQAVLCEPSDSVVSECQSCIAIGTVDEFEIEAIRSVTDNKRHGEEVVILLDYNPFAEDGCVAYELVKGGKRPLYGKDGPTPPESQRVRIAPKVLDFVAGFEGTYHEEVLEHRCEKIDSLKESLSDLHAGGSAQ